LNSWHRWAIAVPAHYLEACGRLAQMDRARAHSRPEFVRDLLPG
jgi:hypothetical protein